MKKKKKKIKKVKIVTNQAAIIGGLEFAKQTFKLIDNKMRISISLNV